MLHQIFTNAITRGQYQILNNIVEYSLAIPGEVMKHLQCSFDNATSSFTLNDLKDHAQHLIADCDSNYSPEIYTIIDHKLTILINLGQQKRTHE